MEGWIGPSKSTAGQGSWETHSLNLQRHLSPPLLSQLFLTSLPSESCTLELPELNKGIPGQPCY